LVFIWSFRSCKKRKRKNMGRPVKAHEAQMN
jgi:hypothetical protein